MARALRDQLMHHWDLCDAWTVHHDDLALRVLLPDLRFHDPIFTALVVAFLGNMRWKSIDDPQGSALESLGCRPTAVSETRFARLSK